MQYALVQKCGNVTMRVASTVPREKVGVCSILLKTSVKIQLVAHKRAIKHILAHSHSHSLTHMVETATYASKELSATTRKRSLGGLLHTHKSKASKGVGYTHALPSTNHDLPSA